MLTWMNRFIRLLVNSKMTFIILLTVVLISSSIFGIFLILESHKSSLISDLTKRSEFLSLSVSEKVQLEILFADTAGLHAISKALYASNNGLIGINYFDAERNLLHGHTYLDQTPFPDSEALFASVELDDAVLVCHQIQDNIGGVVGYSVLAHSLVEIKDRLNGLRNKFLLIAILLISITIIIIVVSINSIIRISRQESESRFNMEVAERNSALQMKFLSNMSHELRTPLNAISGFCNVLYDQDLKEENHKYLSYIKESADTMEYLVNDILDYSKIKNDELSFNEVTFCFSSLYDKTVKMFTSRVNENVAFNYTPLEEAVAVVGDINRIRQLMINLINNAIKYTVEGRIHISAELSQEEGICSIRFTVEDTGIGIADDKRDIIFEPFKQAHDTKKIKVESTGLGLSICRRLVRKMNGEIDYTSVEGEGSTFFFAIQLPIGNMDDCINPSSLHRDNVKIKGNILIAEDTKINQLLLERIFTKWESTFTIVSNGEEAVEKAASQTFDLVLMDIQMPIMGGLEAMAVIKKAQPNLPVIALTANASKENASMYLSKGMDGFVPKPFNPYILALEINKFIPVRFNA